MVTHTPILLGTRRGRFSREFRKLHGEDPVVVGRVVEPVLVDGVEGQRRQNLRRLVRTTGLVERPLSLHESVHELQV